MRTETRTDSDQPILPKLGADNGPAPAEPVPSPVEPMDHDAPIRVLFLCTHNSARSQLAEAVLRLQGGSRVQAFSAGSHPTAVHPMAAALLQEHGVDASLHRSKSMDEFAGQTFDYVITLCDGVRDHCPTFPGDPLRIHWGFPDPSIVEDESARARAFATLWLELNTRIGLLLNLPHPASGQRVRPGSLAGMAEARGIEHTHRLGGATQKLGAFTQKLHLRHGE